jgi:hypothetical protein
MEGLLDVGRALLRLNLPATAATILLRAHELAPDDPEVGITTTSALLAVGDAERAKAVAERAALRRAGDAVASYLTAFSALASGDLATVGQVLENMPAAANKSEEQLVRRIEAMYARARTLSAAGRLDENDLRGWHYVLTAGLLLLRSPHGAHMHGRYGYLLDTPARCRLAIDRLRLVLRHLRVIVPRVVTADDTDSLILGGALARLLSIPTTTMSNESGALQGLIVVYELAGQPAEVIRKLRGHTVNQTLWVHSACWTREESVAGDLTSFLAQSNHPEWRDADVSGPAELEEWIDRILKSELVLEASTDLDDLTNLLDAVLDDNGSNESLRPAALRNDGRRERQSAASPVRSARF